MIEDLLDRSGLVILNNGTPTRIDVNSCKTSCLDLIFASPSLARITNWEVLNDTVGSDHFPVKTAIEKSFVKEVRDRPPRFDYACADWKKFRKRTSEGLMNVNSEDSIDDMCESITGMIVRVASETKPCRRAPRDQVIVPWWNEECKKAVSRREKHLEQ